MLLVVSFVLVFVTNCLISLSCVALSCFLSAVERARVKSPHKHNQTSAEIIFIQLYMAFYVVNIGSNNS